MRVEDFGDVVTWGIEPGGIPALAEEGLDLGGKFGFGGGDVDSGFGKARSQFGSLVSELVAEMANVRFDPVDGDVVVEGE